MIRIPVITNRKKRNTVLLSEDNFERLHNPERVIIHGNHEIPFLTVSAEISDDDFNYVSQDIAETLNLERGGDFIELISVHM